MFFGGIYDHDEERGLAEGRKGTFWRMRLYRNHIQEISERAGVALGLLTHHYGNKEKLFLAAGMDVLERFHDVLQRACDEGKNGRESVLNFCKAYLDFSIDPDSNWLVLVRCSPYSDMKTSDDRELMFEKFNEIHKLLEQQLWRGIEDGSIRELRREGNGPDSHVAGGRRQPYPCPHAVRAAPSVP